VILCDCSCGDSCYLDAHAPPPPNRLVYVNISSPRSKVYGSDRFTTVRFLFLVSCFFASWKPLLEVVAAQQR
jgi:hypothetical protein